MDANIVIDIVIFKGVKGPFVSSCLMQVTNHLVGRLCATFGSQGVHPGLVGKEKSCIYKIFRNTYYAFITVCLIRGTH